MATNVLTINAPKNVRIRGIALPNEHGSWGFLFEPLVAASVIVPTVSAVWISILVIGAFLARQPLKIFISNWQTKRNPEQTKVAYRFIHFYAAITSIGLFGSLLFVQIEHFIPFALVIPFAIYQIYCDVSRKSRKLMSELTGGNCDLVFGGGHRSGGRLELSSGVCLVGDFYCPSASVNCLRQKSSKT